MALGEERSADSPVRANITLVAGTRGQGCPRSILGSASEMALKVLLTAAFMAALTSGSTAASRPNILFCLADDWSWPQVQKILDAFENLGI